MGKLVLDMRGIKYPSNETSAASSLFYPTFAQLNIVFTRRFALKFTLKVLLNNQRQGA
jgi:hypothetical protein